MAERAGWQECGARLANAIAHIALSIGNHRRKDSSKFSVFKLVKFNIHEILAVFMPNAALRYSSARAHISYSHPY